MKRGPLVVAALVLVAVVGTGAAIVVHGRGRDGVTPSKRGADAARAPNGVRVRVEVLNGTRTRGLARRATELLRDRGFDVVDVGTARVIGDTTLVYDVSGHPAWAAHVAANFAPARVVSQPDSSRYLDVSVVLGAAWRAPAEPFYP